MLISTSNQFIFFKPLKCAGTAVEFDLLKYCNETDFCAGSLREDGVTYDYQPVGDLRYHQHHDPIYFFKTYKNIPSLKSIDFENYKKITIVRNPWDQLVSFYWWYIGSNLLTKKINDKLIINKNDSSNQIKNKFNQVVNDNLILDEGFSRETKSVLEELSIANNKFICHEITDYLKFENLNENYYNLLNSLGLSTKKTKLNYFKNKSRKLKLHYSLYYDCETKQKVSYYFKNCIKKFNYKYECMS